MPFCRRLRFLPGAFTAAWPRERLETVRHRCDSCQVGASVHTSVHTSSPVEPVIYEALARAVGAAARVGFPSGAPSQMRKAHQLGPSLEAADDPTPERREIGVRQPPPEAKPLQALSPPCSAPGNGCCVTPGTTGPSKSKSSRPENAQIDPALHSLTGVASPFPALSPANALPVPTSANIQSATAVSRLPMSSPTD